jgi:indole-3-glycerol phosphate synthase
MTILDKIVESTKLRVQNLKDKLKLKYFEESELFNSPIVSLEQYLLKPGKNGVIAEFKRCSPSKGALNAYAKVSEVTVGYMRSGCSALSIITEPDYFNGSTADLVMARKFNYCPILRKDFIIDPIQIFESRAIGADAILLIAKILTPSQIIELTTCAKQLGLEILFEVDDQAGLEMILPEHTLVGINSRNLITMNENISQIIQLKEKVPNGKIIIAESGINSSNQISDLRNHGFKGFLIGTKFMQSSDPAKTCNDFCKEILTKELEFAL